MNKKLLILCAFAVAGFVTLTAFGGKTLEQQKAEISALVAGKLDELRAQKEIECTDRVNLEAQRRYDEYLLTLPTKPTTGKKPTTSKGPGVKPVPVKPPVNPSDPKKDKMENTPVDSKKDKMENTTPAGNTEQKKDKMKKSGGN